MKVLIATDGSEFSKAAVEKCCKMFEDSDNTKIRILSVAMPVSVSAVPFELAHEYVREMEVAAMGEAEKAVTEAEKQVRDHFPDMGGDLTTKAAVGLPKQKIVEEAETWGADLVIVGSHGYGFWKRAYLGSVSNAVMHHAPCSVLVVRPPKLLNA
jgi:nucleotide-binding universal stress UspA family protein